MLGKWPMCRPGTGGKEELCNSTPRTAPEQSAMWVSESEQSFPFYIRL